MSAESVAADHLRAFIERIERVQEEIDGLNADKKAIYAEAKGYGFDTKVIKRIVADRAKDANDLAAFAAVYDLYCEAIGMVPATRAAAQGAA